MNTGIESWNVDLMSIGPMYPFVGSETILVIVGLAAWVLWHWLQARAETRDLEREALEYGTPEALDKVIDDHV